MHRFFGRQPPVIWNLHGPASKRSVVQCRDGTLNAWSNRFHQHSIPPSQQCFLTYRAAGEFETLRFCYPHLYMGITPQIWVWVSEDWVPCEPPISLRSREKQCLGWVGFKFLVGCVWMLERKMATATTLTHPSTQVIQPHCYNHNTLFNPAIGFINTPSLPPSSVFSPIGLPVNLKHCAFATHIFTWVSPPKSEFGCLKIGFHVNPQSLCS